ncbi:MAG: hypothetical protein E6H06_20235 [Bacteroidetes bacterium]|nr:MAG: hypothetical protein E6H06_20235 [Bacteroidota bacterium]
MIDRTIQQATNKGNECTTDNIGFCAAKLDTAHLRLNNSPAANNRIAERWADGSLVSTYVFQFSCISSSTL